MPPAAGQFFCEENRQMRRPKNLLGFFFSERVQLFAYFAFFSAPSGFNTLPMREHSSIRDLFLFFLFLY